jgi:hypothetical protein
LLLWVVQTYGNHLGKVWWVCRMRKTLKMQVIDCHICRTGSMGSCIVMLQKDACGQQSTSLWFDCRPKLIFPHYGFSCCSVLWSHNSMRLARTRSIFHWSHTNCKLPTPFVHLLLWQTCITTLKLHSSINFSGFTPSLHKNRITERCSSLVHVSSGAVIFTLLLWWSLFICTLLPPTGHSLHY